MRAVADIEAAAAAGADALGFVFHEPSPRHLSAADAHRLRAAVPADVACVAVFLRPSQTQVDAALEALRPDWLQADLVHLGRLTLPPGLRVLPVLRKIAGENGSEPFFPQPFSRVLFEGATSGRAERADWA